MSGHSKWSTIKRQKGAADVKRGAVFTKISNAITIAVKQGGGVGDPAQNPKLRLAVEMARGANMPKDNIERAIARATSKEAGDLTELIYEGFAPGGSTAVLVEAVTDNTNRTTSEVKSLFNKAGASFAGPGSVAYQFNQVGEITISKKNHSLDEIFLTAADSGANDVEDRGDEVAIYTDVSSLNTVKEKITSLGYEITGMEISRKAISSISVNSEEKERILNFLASLEDLDDIQKVYSNISLN